MEPDPGQIYLNLAIRLKGVPAEAIQRLGYARRRDPNLNIPAHLEEEGFLTAPERVLLEQLADQAVDACNGDFRQALDLLGDDPRLGELFQDEAARANFERQATAPLPNVLSTPDEPVVLHEIPGRYTHISHHATGGMGRVLLVHDTNTGRDVALKELLPQPNGDATSPRSPVREATDMAARFLQEMRVTAQLEHPSIVPVYELGRRRDGSLYYTMKLVRGITFGRAIDECENLEARLALLPHFINLCQAIAYSHSRGVIHRDIKPSNVMVGEFGETVVLDWGIAKVKRETADPHAAAMRRLRRPVDNGGNGSRETGYGVAIGTPHYMPPEQAEGKLELIDERSDVYSLGAVLYEVLTGSVPFRGDSASQIMARVVGEEPEPIRRLAPDAPAELISICQKAMSKDPAQRYDSAMALADELVRYQSGALVGAYRYKFRELARHYYRRHRAMVNSFGAAAAVILFVVAFAYANIVVAHDREKEQRVAAEHHAYLAEIRLADAYIDDLKFGAARDVLARTQPHQRHLEWGYLMARANQDMATLSGHESTVFSAQYSPDGKWILTAAADQSVGLWNGANHELVRRLQFKDAYVRQAEFSADSRYVAIALTDGTARILDAATGNEIGRVDASSAPVNYASFSPDTSLLVTAASDGLVTVWDWRARKSLHTFPGHQDEVKFAEFTGDGAHIVSWSQDNDIRLWDMTHAAQVAGLHGFRVQLDGARARFAYIEGTQAVIADAVSGAELYRSPEGDAALNNARLSGTDLLITASNDGEARVSRLGADEPLPTISLAEPVKDAFLSPDGTLLATEVARGQVELWEIAAQTKRLDLSGHGYGMTTAAFSPDGARLLTGSPDGTARVWDATQSRLYDRVALHDAAAAGVAFSPDGATIATAGLDDTIHIMDAESYRERARIACQALTISRAVAFSADGKLLAATVEETVPMVFDAATGELVSRYSGHDAWVLDVVFRPRKPEVASTAWNGAVHLWNAQNGEPRMQLSGHEGLVLDCAFDAAGERLATASDDHTARLWNAESGNELLVLQHPVRVTCVAFSRDGQFLATGGDDGIVRLWDAGSGTLTKVLEHHGDSITSVTFAADNRRVLSASWDQTVGIWDTTTGDSYLRTVAEPDIIDALAVGPAGSDFVLATRTGAVMRWDLVPWTAPSEESEGDLEDVTTRYKQRRTERLASRYTGHDPIPVTVITTPDLLRSSLERLHEALVATRASSERGVTIASGPLADAVARLSVRPNDVLTKIDTTPVEDTAGAAAALESTLNSGAVPVFTVERAGQPLNYRFTPQEPIVREEAVTLTREDARQLLEVAKQGLDSAIEPLLQLNHEYAAAVGEPKAARDDLAGLWLIPWESDEGRETYRKLRVNAGDRLVRINDKPVTNRQQLISMITAALADLEQNPQPVPATFGIERGSLKTITRTVTIE